MSKIDETLERICNFFQKNRKFGNKPTLYHFLAEGVPRSTIYDVIQRVRNGLSAKRRKGQGRIAKKMPSKKGRKLGRQFNHKNGKSQTVAAREYGISQPYVNMLLNKLSIKCRKKSIIPDRSEEQAKEARSKCRALTEKYRNWEWRIDNESFFTLSHSSIAGIDFF